ncbi:MAG: aldo/keto reductase [Lachnospiraceae bacterium]|nr:aldo/keto reductase [Lachnospiraceae bacterium]
MYYKEFQGMKLSALGFGAMRLPQQEDGTIDEAQLAQMTAYAIEHGVNYFDTAYPYHNGQSEIALGKALSAYNRDSWYLATKFPGHQISASYEPAPIFENQLRKCGVDYFDFYLLHNVNESSMATYLDPKWKILDYFKEQKRLGRIRHLGFSSHAGLEALRQFLDIAGDDMEFCQIQLNYLDWTLQDAKGKVELLNERNIPIWVMEPVHGGKLCSLGEKEEARLKALRADESVPGWGFRFLQDIPGVTVILSGMSNLTQMQENIATFESPEPLSGEEKEVLLDIAEGMKDSVPCTACRYCTEECPQGLDIPTLIAVYNELRIAPTFTTSMRLELLPEDKQPSACLSCGKCAKMCPQSIQIPEVMKDLAAKLEGLPKWADISREREKASRKWNDMG